MTLRHTLAAIALACATAAQGQGFETFNQSNLARFAALPGLGQGAVVPQGESINSVTLDWTNEFFVRAEAGEDSLPQFPATDAGHPDPTPLRYGAGFRKP